MCEGEDEPLCVKWCITDALVLEEREEEVEVMDEPEELEIGLASLVEKHGMRKIVDAVARISSAKKG
jgi:benzoyl-CoA reductase subunit BamC